jgi:hypothetical protein
VGTLREEQAKLAGALKATGQPHKVIEAESQKPDPEVEVDDGLAGMLGEAEPEAAEAATTDPPKTMAEARAALITAAKPENLGEAKVLAILKKTLGVERLSKAPVDEAAFGRFVAALGPAGVARKAK